MTKIYIVNNSIIRKTHIINIGSSKILKQLGQQKSHLSKDSDISNETATLLREMKMRKDGVPVNLVRITNEIKKTIFEFQRENHADIDTMLITGGGIVFDQVRDYLEKELSVQVQVSDPFSKVDNPAYLDAALKKVGPEFAVAIGLALRGLSS
jgi:Tfp pilus assembly PilM family ATPase